MFPSVSSDRQAVVEFIEDGHVYLLDGIVTPSVSQLLKQVFPNKYKGVPASVLANKAEYGSKVHEAIERAEKGLEMRDGGIYIKIALAQYDKLKKKHGFTVQDQEQVVWYKDKFCGRYDLTVTNADGLLCLDDIKTTYQLDRDYLAWQLSLYELGYEWVHDLEPFPFAEFHCLWLPRGELGEYVKIERIDRQRLLEEFGWNE